MLVEMPAEVRRLPLDRPRVAIQAYATILAELRDVPDGAAADLEALATEAIEAARREGTFLMAVVTPPNAAPALLTGFVLEVPESWSGDVAELLRDSMEDVGGPDVRETITVETGLGPAVIAQRVPGVEQAREGGPLTLQLQAFVAEPGTGRMLLLTLACPSAAGWQHHQRLFAELVTSAQRPHETPEESFEERTYQL
jgi:hypothetical protein